MNKKNRDATDIYYLGRRGMLILLYIPQQCLLPAQKSLWYIFCHPENIHFHPSLKIREMNSSDSKLTVAYINILFVAS